MPQFRTAPRGDHLPTLTVAIPDEVDLVSPAVVRLHYGISPWELPPPESHLRHVHDLEPGDHDQLLAVTRSIGDLSMDPWVFVSVTSAFELGLTEYFDRSAMWADAATAEAQHVRPGQLDALVALDKLDFCAQVLRAVVRHGLAGRLGEDPTDAWSYLLPNGEREPDRCWAIFRTVVNGHLRDYAPRLEVQGLGPPFAPITGDEAHPTPFAGVVAQLYTSIVEGLELRTCPECGQMFERQTGRSVAGQNRTSSVTYCSRYCARRKANRDYKARERAKRQ